MIKLKIGKSKIIISNEEIEKQIAIILKNLIKKDSFLEKKKPVNNHKKSSKKESSNKDKDLLNIFTESFGKLLLDDQNISLKDENLDSLIEKAQKSFVSVLTDNNNKMLSGQEVLAIESLSSAVKSIIKEIYSNPEEQLGIDASNLTKSMYNLASLGEYGDKYLKLLQNYLMNIMSTLEKKGVSLKEEEVDYNEDLIKSYLEDINKKSNK